MLTWVYTFPSAKPKMLVDWLVDMGTTKNSIFCELKDFNNKHITTLRKQAHRQQSHEFNNCTERSRLCMR